jgi:NadR type nicotinamide-nucleotide adenylyltransferase
MPLRKIVIIGPESTGKSTLCEALAAHYRTEWVREYAREYLEKHGMEYGYETLSVIARGQLALEEMGIEAKQRTTEPASANGLLFIDTDLYVIKVWSEYVFGRCAPWILNEIVRRKYDGYLLANTDLPWADDPLREYPDPGIRVRLFHIYKDLLINQSVPWAEVSGVGAQRLACAISATSRLLQ